MGAAVRNLCGQSSCSPVSGLPRGLSQWAQAEGGRLTPAPLTPSSTTSQEAGRGRLAGVPKGWDSGSRPEGPRGPGAAGAASGGVELRPPPCGPAPPFGWVPRSSRLSCSFVPVTRSSRAGVHCCRGGNEGRMGRRRTAASQETLGDSPGRGREVAGRAGGDKLGRPGRDSPTDRQRERNSEGGDGGVIKMLTVPAGCWVILGAEISGNGSCYGEVYPRPPTRTTTTKYAFFSPSESVTISCAFDFHQL